MTLLVLISFYVMMMVHESLESSNLTKLLKEYPTWSFELESVESVIKNTVSAVKGSDFLMKEEMLRDLLAANLAPGSTHIVRKVADPKWIQDPKKLPLHFDAREKWKDCAGPMSTIQDEGACHADSAVTIVSVINDRYCIFTNGSSKETLSAEILIGCAEFCTNELQYLDRTWDFATENGIPTGGAKGTNEGCLPYEEAPCLHGNATSVTGKKHELRKLKPCDMTYDHDCPEKCTNPKYPKPLDQDLLKCKTSYYLAGNEYCIKRDILAYGPVVTGVVLYDDFYKKPEGIYFGKKGRKYVAWRKYLKLIGWGEEDNVKYWLAVNTWDQWGDKVYKVPRGVYFDLVEYFPTACVFDD